MVGIAVMLLQGGGDSSLAVGLRAPPMTVGSFAPAFTTRNMDLSVNVNRGKPKTRKAAAKRFKVTSSGKVMAKHAGKQHLNEKMSAKKKKALSNKRRIETADIPLVQGCLPYKKLQ